MALLTERIGLDLCIERCCRSSVSSQRSGSVETLIENPIKDISLALTRKQQNIFNSYKASILRHSSLKQSI